MLKKLFSHLKNNTGFVILILGIFSWIPVMFKSGLKYPFGIGFWGPNGHDGVWHIALARSLSEGSFENPVYAGENLKNYHLGFDILLAIIHKLTTIEVSTLYFQILPVIFAILIGVLTYLFVFNLSKDKKSAAWSVFFVFFGGSLAYFLGHGESAFWSQQAISTLINPPFTLSLILILGGLILLQKNKIIFAILVFSLLIQIKVYAGLLVLFGLLITSLYQIFSEGKKTLLKVFLLTSLLSLILFIPLGKSASSMVSWRPFWFLETMMNYQDRLDWQRFYSAMTNYKLGGVWIKAILAYGVAFIIFILGNFGTRLIFLKDIFKNLTSLKVFCLAVILGGIVVPTFFVQSGTAWNTIQFMYYSLFFSAILAGISISNEKVWVKVMLVFLTIPTTIITLKDVYIPSRPPAMLPNYEIEALEFLEKQPDGVVLTFPFDLDKAKEAESNPPRPLYLYESTAYVSAYSGKKVFLEDEVNLNIMGYDWETRRQTIIDCFYKCDDQLFDKLLSKYNIKYLYLVRDQKMNKEDNLFRLDKIFQNTEVSIYEHR